MNNRNETRKTTCYHNITSTSGDFSPRIGKETNQRLTKYCKATDQNKTKFVEQCINEKLDVVEREIYESMSRDELINLLMKGGVK